MPSDSEIKKLLSRDDSIKFLDKALDIVISKRKDEFEDALVGVIKFFRSHVESGLLPFNDVNKYETTSSLQIYKWMNVRYDKLFDFLINENDFFINENILDSIIDLYEYSRNSLLERVIALCFVKIKPEKVNDIIKESNTIQGYIYKHLTENIEDNFDFAIHIIKNPLSNTNMCKEYAELFFVLKSNGVNDEQMVDILNNFSVVMSSVDDKLLLYDFLFKNVERGSILGALALPYIIEASIQGMVDIAEYYELAYKSITKEALQMKGRSKFLKILELTLTSSSVKQEVIVAFSIKLSRYLLNITPDAQLDVLNLLYNIVKAHTSVKNLLNYIEGPVIDIESCDFPNVPAQTLHEVLCLKDSPFTLISQAAKDIGLIRAPEPYESVTINEIIKTNKTLNHASADLDKRLW